MTDHSTLPPPSDTRDADSHTQEFPYTITERLQDSLHQALDSAESPRDLGIA